MLVEGKSSAGCRGPEGCRAGGVVSLSAGGAPHSHRGGGQAHGVPSAGGVVGGVAGGRCHLARKRDVDVEIVLTDL